MIDIPVSWWIIDNSEIWFLKRRLRKNNSCKVITTKILPNKELCRLTTLMYLLSFTPNLVYRGKISSNDSNKHTIVLRVIEFLGHLQQTNQRSKQFQLPFQAQVVRVSAFELLLLFHLLCTGTNKCKPGKIGKWEQSKTKAATNLLLYFPFGSFLNY